MSIQLDHLNLTVANFHESAEWYRRLFGFEIVEEGIFDGLPWGVLRSDDSMLCVYEHGDYRYETKTNQRADGVHGLNHFAFRITNKEAWERTLQTEKVEVNYGGPIRWTHSTSWYVNDPTGYEIEVAFWDQGAPRF